MGKFDCVVEILKKHRCTEFKISEDSLICEWEHVLVVDGGIPLVVCWKYDFTNGLTIEKIIDQNDIYTDVKEKYRNNPDVKGKQKLINKEIERDCK